MCVDVLLGHSICHVHLVLVLEVFEVLLNIVHLHDSIAGIVQLRVHMGSSCALHVRMHHVLRHGFHARVKLLDHHLLADRHRLKGTIGVHLPRALHQHLELGLHNVSEVLLDLELTDLRQLRL